MFPPISLRSFIKRATQAGIDVVLPITGMGGLQALSQAVPAVREAGVYESGEEALGLGGQLLQTSGINVRAENIDAMLRREHPNFVNLPRKVRKALRAKMIDRVYGE
jgi:pyruvate carboxylase